MMAGLFIIFVTTFALANMFSDFIKTNDENMSCKS